MSGVARVLDCGAGVLPRALTTAQELCATMDSLRPACEHLCSRLKDLHEELEFTKHKSQSFSTNALGQCKAVATKLLRFLERNSSKNLVYHVINHTAVAGELKALHEEVSELFFDFLDVTGVGQWEDDRHALETVLTTAISDASIALRDLQSPRAQLEAMLTLKFELEKQHERHNETDKARMSSLMETIKHRSRVAVGQLPAWFLPSNQVEFESQPFAKSSCGSVHRGVKNGSPVVVKCCAVDDMRIDIRTARQLEKEMDRLFQMEHTHIVKMLGACHVSSPPFLVYEDAINGDMGSYLSLSEDNKKEMWKLFYQAALGLAFIHSQGVIHGCLKLSNILVGADGQARLTDFGLRTMRAISKTHTCSSAHLRWRAPECLTRRPTFASDVYSLAMCMIEASAGEPPFAFLDDDDVRETLKSGVIPEKPQEMSDQVWELVGSMTHADPSKRVELTLVIDTLKTLATEDLGVGGVARCIVCTALVLDYSRSCAQCGNQLGLQDESSSSCGSPAHVASPSVVVELDATSSIVDLVAVLRSGSNDEQESAVLLLLQACICDHKRQQMQQENGVSVLEDLVKTGRTHLLQVCALGCLCWSCELDSTPPDAEFEALQETIGAPTESECASLAQMLCNNDHDKLRTVMYCACAAGANGRRQLFNAGVVPPLVTLLGSGNEALTIWTMDALGNLACGGEARSAIVAEGAIPVLVELLKNGSETQRGFAACVLGQLSADSASNSATVVESGAIPFLVGLLRAQATIPKNFAVFALDGIAAVRDEYGVAIARNGGIPRLIRLLRTGTSRQKKLAACVLGWLANQDEN